MTELQITFPVTQDELLHVVEQLDANDLNEFASRVQALRAGRRHDVLTMPETELLEQINEGLPPTTWERYRLLRNRKEDETLTELEYEELLAISDQIELANANRIEALVKLAALKGVAIRELMESLEITSSGYYE